MPRPRGWGAQQLLHAPTPPTGDLHCTCERGAAHAAGHAHCVPPARPAPAPAPAPCHAAHPPNPSHRRPSAGGNPEVTVLALLGIFGVWHSGLAGLRPKAEEVIGARAYRVIFALGSLALAAVPIFYFINHRCAASLPRASRPWPPSGPPVPSNRRRAGAATRGRLRGRARRPKPAGLACMHGRRRPWDAASPVYIGWRRPPTWETPPPPPPSPVAGTTAPPCGTCAACRASTPSSGSSTSFLSTSCTPPPSTSWRQAAACLLVRAAAQTADTLQPADSPAAVSHAGGGQGNAARHLPCVQLRAMRRGGAACSAWHDTPCRPPHAAQVAAVDKPKLHMWETGIMRISRHPQAVGQAIWCAAHTLWIGG